LAVLNALLPGVLTGPQGHDFTKIVNAVIDGRADALAKVLAAAANHDLGGVSEAILEAYMSDNSVVICSIVHDISTDLEAAVCGPIGDFIHGLAVDAGEVTDDVVDAITRPLDIPKDVLALINVFDHDCTPPGQYYANIYARCYHHAVRELLSSNPAQFDQLAKSLDGRCRADYIHCFTVEKTANIDKICPPQRGTFSSHAHQLVLSVNSAADSYKRYFPQFVRELARQQGLAAACDRQSALQKFLADCAKQVEKQVPLLGDPESDNCDTGTSTFSVVPVAQLAACEKAMAQTDVDAALKDVCAPLFALTGDASLLGETGLPVMEPIPPP
jgi:hypothetical protein